MANGKITSIVERILKDFLKENKLELYNVEFVKEGKDWFLRVYIDKASDLSEEYVSTDDCELVSRYLSDYLDDEDPIEQNYYLEVSSPGMDRPLNKEKDFSKYAGRQVDISLYQAFNGKKEIQGTLMGMIEGKIVITNEKGEKIEFPIEKVAKTRLAVIF